MLNLCVSFVLHDNYVEILHICSEHFICTSNRNMGEAVSNVHLVCWFMDTDLLKTDGSMDLSVLISPVLTFPLC